jgi:hypothetical protein
MAEAELPSPEELEEQRSNKFTKRIALTTAIYAVFLAVASLGGNHATKEMLLAQQQASDLWAHYQAKSIREHQSRVQKLRVEADLIEREPSLRPDGREKLSKLLAKYGEDEQRYNTDKKEIEKQAKELEHERDLYRTKDPYFDYGEALLQIAIVMASIAILSSSRQVFIFSLVIAVVGGFFALNGFLLFAQIPFLHGRH